MKVGALCAGYGGLELALQFLGLEPELLWFSEIDSNAAKVVEARFGSPPNLGDLTKIGDAPPVDVVTAGFPCQPVSTSGKRDGVHDERWLIEDVCKIGRKTGARWLILENVSGLLSANGGDAMARTVAALAENGFSAEWVCVRASDIGATHERLRWFCLAHSGDARRKQRKNDATIEKVGRIGATAPDARRVCPQVSFEREQSTVPVVGSVSEAGRTNFGPYADAIARWEPVVGRAAPQPTDDKQRLNPAFVEWMMGIPEGWVTDLIQNRAAALKLLGNGVVPQQAAFALSELFVRCCETFDIELDF